MLLRGCVRLTCLLLTFAIACGKGAASSPDASGVADMCVDTNGVGGACTEPDAVASGTCFESPRCVCVFPEATWVCCYAGYGGHDAPGVRIGDPFCGLNVVVGQPGYPCYCDSTHHWACPLDLGATD